MHPLESKLEKLREGLISIYKKYDMDESGISCYDVGCTEPCCYKGKEERAIPKIEHLLKKLSLNNYVYSSNWWIGDYPGIENAISSIRIRSCEHKWEYVGLDSHTSRGAMHKIECKICDFHKYTDDEKWGELPKRERILW